MAAAVIIKHRAPGRMRLQYSEDAFCQEDLNDTIANLRKKHHLRRVEQNPITRSVLIEADSEEELQSAISDLTREALFTEDKSIIKPQVKLWSWQMRAARDRLDRQLKHMSDGHIDFRSAMALLFVALGLRQFTRGKFLPAGLTLVIYALGFLHFYENGEDSFKTE